MRVSILIPSYGQALYLVDAIESALNQTYKDIEIIVIDDGSTDGSLQIAKSYEPRIKVIQQVNKGLASARNTGIMNATGDYILPLDADDILLPNCVETLMKHAESGADVIAPSIICFTSDNEQYTQLIPNPSFDDFKEGNRLAYCAAIKRSALLEVGGYSPKMDTLGGWEDLHLWYDLLSRGKKIMTIPEPLMRYRVKAVSMVTEARKNSKNLWAQIIKDFPGTQSHADFQQK